MKKVIIMAVALLMMSAGNMKAENIEANVNYDFNLSMKAIDKAMILTMEQVDFLKPTIHNFNRQVRKLHKVKPEERAQVLNKMLTRNLIDVHGIVLDKQQYRAYLQVLNNEINRTGLNHLLATAYMADAE